MPAAKKDKPDKRYADSLDMFKNIGVFQEGAKTYFNYFALIFWLIFGCTAMLMYMCWAIQDMYNNGTTTLKIFFLLSTSSIYYQIVYVYIAFWCTSEHYFIFLNKLEAFELSYKTKIIEYYNKFLFLGTRAMISVCFCVTIGFIVYAKCENYEENCGLMLNATVFFVDINYTPARQIICSIQNITMLVALLPLNSIIGVLFMVHISLICMYKHVGNKLLEIKSLETRSARKIHIKKCVQLHQEVLQLHNYSHSFTKYLIASLSFQNISVVALMYQYFMNDVFEVILIISSVCWVAASFVLSQMMESLSASSLSVAAAAYDCMPMEDDFATQQELEIIMDMALKPRHYKIFKVVIIDNNFFLLGIKIGYTLFSLLRQVYSKNET